MSFKIKFLLAAFCAGGLASGVYADVQTASIFGNNMVLQRESPVPVWGKADPGEAVEVSFAGQTVKTAADEKGRWKAVLAPLAAAKDGADLTVKGKNLLTFKNVVVGDVWLCSGQSNMEMSFTWGIMDGGKFLAEADQFPLIRRIKFHHAMADYPQENAAVSSWSVCSSKTAGEYTVAGYFFVRRLYMETGIPMGILDDNWSGCRIEPYMAPDGFHQEGLENIAKLLKNFDLSSEEGKAFVRENMKIADEWKQAWEKTLADTSLTPPALPVFRTLANTAWNASSQYNAMIAPITNFPIKGAIWYQGCSNGNEGDSYYFKMCGLVDGWRKAWKNDFPFYFVQLAAFTAATSDPAGGNGYALIREAQRRSLSIPKTGMACAIDIGMQNDIHPKNKFDVGERLARWALYNDYGKKDIVVSGPLFRSMKVEGNKIRLAFDYAKGLMVANKTGLEKPAPVADGKPAHFAIAGADKVWHWADAVIDGETVIVSSPEVAEPVAVRYAYRAYPDGVNMYNAEGLPMVPFRTDKW